MTDEPGVALVVEDNEPVIVVVSEEEPEPIAVTVIEEPAEELSEWQKNLLAQMNLLNSEISLLRTEITTHRHPELIEPLEARLTSFSIRLEALEPKAEAEPEEAEEEVVSEIPEPPPENTEPKKKKFHIM